MRCQIAKAHFGEPQTATVNTVFLSIVPSTLIETSEVRLLLIGGKPGPAQAVVTTASQALDVLKAWSTVPVDGTSIQYGLPISYRVNYLNNNQLARIAMTTGFTTEASSPIPYLKSWDVTFFSGSEGKNRDSNLTVEIKNNGILIARGDVINDEYPANSLRNAPLTTYSNLLVRDLATCTFTIQMTTNGDDTWIFTYSCVGARNDGGHSLINGVATLTESSGFHHNG